MFSGCIKGWRAFSKWNPSNGGLDYLQVHLVLYYCVSSVIRIEYVCFPTFFPLEVHSPLSQSQYLILKASRIQQKLQFNHSDLVFICIASVNSNEKIAL